QRVFDRDRHATQLAQGRTALTFAIDRGGGGERGRTRDVQERMQPALRFHARKCALRQRHRANFAVFDLVRLLRDRQIEDVGHSSTNAGTANPPPALRGASLSARSLLSPGTTKSGRSGAPSTATCVVSSTEEVSSSASEFTYSRMFPRSFCMRSISLSPSSSRASLATCRTVSRVMAMMSGAQASIMGGVLHST